ncbi:MAG: VIT and VWA domain-containing protein [Fimbriimonas sp.]
MRRSLLGAGVSLSLGIAAFAMYPAQRAQAQPSTEPGPGQLQILDNKGIPASLCPLKGTKVDAALAGFGARVTVIQTFTNPSPGPIEAVYTFPLPADAAVDRMRIKIGSRIIEGTIKRREEARRIYDAAKNAGQAAALLDQERPNIFTQSVANIMPKAEIQVEISYVQILKYEAGQFEFNYPMVVGPRFLGNAEDAGLPGRPEPWNRVNQAVPSKIAPPITPKGTRTGANIDITVRLDAGAPIQDIKSVLHQINVNRQGKDGAIVRLAKRDEIPNKDFVLRYRTATDTVQSAFVTTYDGKKGGFFSLILLPPRAPVARQIAPREMMFVMDQSGSQSGFPIIKSKELTLKLIKTLRPSDTFNVFGFNNTVRPLFTEAQPVTPENITAAESFVAGMEATGGTQLLEGLNAALQPAKDPERLRIVVFNTDGYVGDEPQILDRIVKTRDTTRIFTFGIGNAVNQFLIDTMSREGRGDSETVMLAESADGAVGRFLQRTRTPILTDVSATVTGLEVTELTPTAIPDVFSEKPIVIMGRYENPGHGMLTVNGRLGGKPWSQTLNLDFSAEAGTSCVSTLWARKKVDDLQSESYLNMVRRSPANPKTKAIVDIALEFGLMTQYTSFVAVEPRVINIAGKPHTVRVPIEMADGVSYEMGDVRNQSQGTVSLGGATFGNARSSTRGFGGGVGGGAGGPGGTTGSTTGGTTGGGGATKALALPPQVYAGQIPVRKRELAFAKDKAMAEGKQLSPAELEKANYEVTVAKSLRDAKGQVTIMIWLDALDNATIAKLKKAGLKVAQTDKALRLVFGTCDAKALKALAKIEAIDRIEPVE